MGARFSSNKDYNRVLAIQPRTSIDLPNFQTPSHFHPKLSEELSIPEPVRVSRKNQNEPPVIPEEKITPVNQSENNALAEQVVVHSAALTIRPNSPGKYHIMANSAFILSRAIINPNDPRYKKYLSSTFQPFRSVVEHNGKQYLVEFEERIQKRYVQCMDETTQKTRLFEVIDRIPCRTVQRYNRNNHFLFNNDAFEKKSLPNFQSDEGSAFSPVHRDLLPVPFNSNNQSTQQYTPSYPFNTQSKENFTSFPPTNRQAIPSSSHINQSNQHTSPSSSSSSPPSSSSSSSSSSSLSSLSHNKKPRQSFESYNDAKRQSISSSVFSTQSNQQSSTSYRNTSNEQSIPKPSHTLSRINQYESTAVPRLSDITNQNTTPSIPGGYTFASHNNRRSSYSSTSKKPRYAPPQPAPPLQPQLLSKTKTDLQSSSPSSASPLPPQLLSKTKTNIQPSSPSPAPPPLAPPLPQQLKKAKTNLQSSSPSLAPPPPAPPLPQQLKKTKTNLQSSSPSSAPAPPLPPQLLNKTKTDLQSSSPHNSPEKSTQYSLPNPRLSSRNNPSTSNINAKPSFRTHTPTISNSGSSSSRTSANFNEEDDDDVYEDYDKNADHHSKLNISSNQTNASSSLNSVDPFARTKNPINQHHYRQRPNIPAYDEPILNNPKFLQSKKSDYAPIPASIRFLNNNQYSRRNNIHKNEYVTS